MPEFRPAGAGRVRVLMDDAETGLFRFLAGELRAALSSDDRENAVTRRLYPSSYEDQDEEASFREIVGDSLMTEKLEALEKVTNSLGDKSSDITISSEDLGIWLASLTDMRLAIGTRLDVDADKMAAEIDPRDEDAQQLAILHWLGWLQEGLISAAES